MSPDRESLGEAGCTINVYRLRALILVSREFGNTTVCERMPVRCRKLLSLHSHHLHSCYFKFSTQTQAEIAVSKSLVSKNLGFISKSVDNSIKAQLLLRLQISRAVQLLHPFGNSCTQKLLQQKQFKRDKVFSERKNNQQLPFAGFLKNHWNMKTFTCPNLLSATLPLLFKPLCRREARPLQRSHHRANTSHTQSSVLVQPCECDI